MRKLFFLFFFSLQPLWAVDEPLQKSATEGQTYNYMAEIVNMLVTLAFVIVLIILSVWFLKKIMRSKVNALNASNGIKILERRFLGPKTSLYLIDVLGKGIVISESQAGVQVITEFPENVNLEQLLDNQQEVKKSGPSLFENMTHKMKKRIFQNNG